MVIYSEKHMTRWIIIIGVTAIVFSACAGSAEPTATPLPMPTDTPAAMPSNTPAPTDTPMPTPVSVTIQDVVDLLYAADLGVSDVQVPPRPTDSPLPNSYRERVEFNIAEVAPKGGQIFVCDTKRHCDALYAYFDMLIALAGPYLYQSPSGTVVAQLNSGLSPDTAARFEAVIMSLP